MPPSRNWQLLVFLSIVCIGNSKLCEVREISTDRYSVNVTRKKEVFKITVLRRKMIFSTKIPFSLIRYVYLFKLMALCL